MNPMRVYLPSKRHRTYWIEFKDHQGIWRRLSGYRAKNTSHRCGERIMRLVEARQNGDGPPIELSDWLQSMPEKMRKKLVRWGLIDRRRFAQALPIRLETEAWEANKAELDEKGQPLTHLASWKQDLLDSNNTPQHAKDQVAYVRRLLTSINVIYASELTADAVKAELATRRRAGLSESGSNHYLQAIKQFTHWMRVKGRSPDNPLELLEAVKTQEEPPHQRRPLTVEEFQQLASYLKDFGRYPKQRATWTGYDRLMLYWTAVSTALRLGALRGLRVADFHFGDDRSGVTLPAHLAKNRKDHEILLPPDLAGKLKAYFEDADPADPAFPIPGDNGVVDTLRKDLAAAKVAAKTEQGLIDFHAFRHTAITWWLDVYELNPRRVMELAQLSSLELVMRYSRRFRLADSSYLDRAPVIHLDAKPKGKKNLRAKAS
ncbi:MAG: tyrosine-type recombinase/integrase [Phycisphaerae bacterium]